MANHILKDIESAKRIGEIFKVDPAIIRVVDGWNDRTDFTGEDELVASIKEVGVEDPLTVTKTKDGILELVDGERRLRATMRARAESGGPLLVPVIVMNKKVPELELYMKSITANTGKPLTPTEQANSFKRLNAWGVTVKEIAARACVSETHVRNRLELSNAIPAVKKAVDDKEITVQTAQGIIKDSDGKVDAQVDALEKKKAEPKKPRKPKVKPLKIYLNGGSVRYLGGANFETCPPLADLLVDQDLMGKLSAAGFDPESISITIEKVLPVETEVGLFDCQKTGLSDWCCNTDVKLVQLKSEVNVYEGEKVYMCKRCRRANNGCFRIVERGEL